MAIDDALISTGVDSLIKLVHSIKKIELNDTALKLGIPAETIEEWAHILEDEGILRIEYRLTKVYLVWVGIQPKELLRRTEAAQDQKEELGKEIQFLLARLEDPGLDAMQVQLARFLEGFNQKVQEVKKAKESYKALQEEKQGIFSKFSKLAQASEEDLRKTIVALDGAQKRLEKIKQEIGDLKTKTSVDDIERAYAKMKDFQKVYSSLEEMCDEEVGRIKRLKKEYDIEVKELNSAYEEVEEKLGVAQRELEQKIQQMGSTVEGVEALLARRPELEELSDLAREIQSERDKVTKQLTILAREVAILNVQTAPDIQKVKERVSETVREEEIYEEKRKRLLMMVKKMLAQETSKDTKGV